jgi:hypothetical protein
MSSSESTSLISYTGYFTLSFLSQSAAAAGQFAIAQVIVRPVHAAIDATAGTAVNVAKSATTGIATGASWAIWTIGVAAVTTVGSGIVAAASWTGGKLFSAAEERAKSEEFVNLLDEDWVDCQSLSGDFR